VTVTAVAGRAVPLYATLTELALRIPAASKIVAWTGWVCNEAPAAVTNVSVGAVVATRTVYVDVETTLWLASVALKVTVLKPVGRTRGTLQVLVTLVMGVLNHDADPTL
jgi:uncharacterized membrane protein YcfT